MSRDTMPDFVSRGSNPPSTPRKAPRMLRVSYTEAGTDKVKVFLLNSESDRDAFVKFISWTMFNDIPTKCTPQPIV